MVRGSVLSPTSLFSELEFWSWAPVPVSDSASSDPDAEALNRSPQAKFLSLGFGDHLGLGGRNMPLHSARTQVWSPSFDSSPFPVALLLRRGLRRDPRPP